MEGVTILLVDGVGFDDERTFRVNQIVMKRMSGSLQTKMRIRRSQRMIHRRSKRSR